jgi:hypothetical protein
MSLEKWAKYGWLKAEPTSRDEIKSLLTIVERDLKDANVPGGLRGSAVRGGFQRRSHRGERCLASGWLSHVNAGRASHKDH